eukprot:GDKK01031395.1.p1 GENE.GDKK01031395.1~~GDKK01031395.1.p1  ORF type:complete len:895 (-),score=273.63 GDKK01031395.1:85-2769(-)
MDASEAVPRADGDEKVKDQDAEEFEATAFEQLEREFQEVLQELVGDKSLEHFRLEYEKLYRTLKKSHESEKRLIRKCRELNAEIVSNAARVQTALRLSSEDQATIAQLQREIERAWKMVEASQEKETKARETVVSLRSEIANLSKLVEQGAGLSINQENTVNDLLKQREELQKDRDLLSQSVAHLTTQNNDLHDRLKKLDSQREQYEKDIQALKDVLVAKKAEAESELRKKAKLDNEVKELKKNLDETNSKNATLQLELNEEKKRLAMRQDEVKHLNAALEEKTTRMQKIEADAAVTKEKSSNQEAHVKYLDGVIRDKNLELQDRTSQCNKLAEDLKKMEAMRDKLSKEKDAVEKQKEDVERSRAAILAEVNAVNKALESLRKQAEADKKQVSDLLRERDILNDSVLKADSTTKQHAELVTEHLTRANKLSAEIKDYKRQADDHIREKAELKRDNDNLHSLINQAKAKYLAAMEDLKARDNSLSDLKKQLTELKARLAQQKNLYEAVRTDRNLYSKNLIESQDEIAEMKTKFRVLYHQIEQLKEEIREQERAIVQEHFEMHKVTRENERLSEEVSRSKERVKTLEATTIQQKTEINKLENTIAAAEAERNTQRKEYETIIAERDILGTQLIRRNDELALLYEKLKIQKSALEKGEVQYRERLNEVINLRRKLSSLTRELQNAKSQVASIDELKHTVHRLQKDLLHEQTKVKALSEELENPLNVHRWRKLEGSDPATFEALQKIQSLQRRLVHKSEEVVEKDMRIQEQEKVYTELRALLARQPGAEVVAQLSQCQQSLKDKERKMKAMASELNMYHSQVQEYKDEIERLTHELHDIKRKFFEKRKMETASTLAANVGVGMPLTKPNPALTMGTTLKVEGNETMPSTTMVNPALMG